MDDFYNKTKPHCNKCGRRCRHGHRLKCKREQRLFPTELSLHPIIPQSTSRKSNKNNILLDQLIEVQQLDDTRYDNDYITDKLQRVQQMVYLRENINNLTYREVHFPNEYIILKRLEEKNNLMHQNRFKVDQFFRSLKLQYQTMSTLFQNIPITSFDLSQTDLNLKSPISENIDTNDNSSIVDPILITSYNEYNQHQYSHNAIPSFVKPKKQNCEFDTAVIIDVTKYPQFQPEIMFLPGSQNLNYTDTSSKSLSFTNSHTTSNPSTTDTNNNKVVNKIKQILNTLQKNLLNQISSKINQSISMTSDSLITNRSIQITDSVSKSKDILQIELDSLNQTYSSSVKLLNPAKNINTNQQTSEDDQINPSLQYMSPSFMFVLQILLLTCLLNQFLIYYFFGIVPNDILTSILTDNSQSLTPK